MFKLTFTPIHMYEYYKFLEMTSNFVCTFHYLGCRTMDITQPITCYYKNNTKVFNFLVFYTKPLAYTPHQRKGFNDFRNATNK